LALRFPEDRGTVVCFRELVPIVETMGNCLKSQATDDISLLRGSNEGIQRRSQELSSSDAYVPSPSYEERVSSECPSWIFL
jgi:hypothetical protein